MNNDRTNINDSDIPASLRRGKKEPMKYLHVSVPLPWWQELKALGREFDQDISVFLREAIQDWLRRARKVQKSTKGDQGCEI